MQLEQLEQLEQPEQQLVVVVMLLLLLQLFVAAVVEQEVLVAASVALVAELLELQLWQLHVQLLLLEQLVAVVVHLLDFDFVPATTEQEKHLDTVLD